MKKSIVIEALAGVFAMALAVSAATVSAADGQPAGEYQPRIDKEGWEILFDGKSLVVVQLNGKETVRADLSRWVKAGHNPDGRHNKFPHAIGELPREGFLLLQNYGGTPVWFRNVRLKPLSDRKPQYTGKEPIGEVLRKAATR